MPTTFSTSYCGPAPLPDDFWGRWNFDPWLIAAMLLFTAIFAFRPASRQDRLVFSAAMATLVLIFISPLCALTVALFSARVVHHVLLVAVAAPLLGSLLRGKKFGKMLAPLTGLQVAIFWLWHAPDAYQLALTSKPIYWLMQATLLGSATAMWAAIFNATPARAIGALLFLTIQMGLLGALLVFSQPLYAPHFSATIPFGFTPGSDQQLAGLIMWVPASLPYLAIGLWRLLTLLRQPEGRSA